MRALPEANAGPMADIAFLLLIFFLVATTMNGEKGIQRKMPAADIIETKPHPKRNTLVILVNNENRIMVNERIVNISELHKEIRAFVLNNGDGNCAYCFESSKNPNSSDNPVEALVAIDVQTETSYETYVQVQNEISAVYNILRNDYSKLKFKMNFEDLSSYQQKSVKAMFPLLLSENVLHLN